jgi:hypothetical protein
VMFEMRKKFSVRQVLELGSIIRHDIDLSREEVGQQVVLVTALVGTGNMAQSVGRPSEDIILCSLETLWGCCQCR